MASSQPTFDLGAPWQSFLLSGYVSRLFDSRIDPDERLALRMELESLILSHGPLMLREVQKCFNVSSEALLELRPVQEWFVTFVSSLESDWLKETNLALIARFWYFLESTRLRRTVTELILRIEFASDPRVVSGNWICLKLVGETASGR
jgi:hypothetical protein